MTEIDPQFAAGIKSERARICAILGCEEAKGRNDLALQTAMHTDLDVDAARKLLAASRKESAASVNLFAAAMAQLGNPNVGADGGDFAATPVGIDTAAIYAERSKARTATPA